HLEVTTLITSAFPCAAFVRGTPEVVVLGPEIQIIGIQIRDPLTSNFGDLHGVVTTRTAANESPVRATVFGLMQTSVSGEEEGTAGTVEREISAVVPARY